MTNDFEGFAFKPWMGYLAAAVFAIGGWNRKDDLAILLRALGMFCFFATSARSQHLRRKQTGGDPSSGELGAVVLAGVSALLALGILVSMLTGRLP